ncbi:hypothetical protein CTI14_26770, partial [Methylobacterium radiotolerans]
MGRILEQISWSVATYRRWRSRPVRVVNAHSVAVLPVCHAIARRHRAALIYDTHELETETSTSHGVQGKIFRMIERHYIRRCDAVFVVNESIADWYRAAYPGARVTSVPQCAAPGSGSAGRRSAEEVRHPRRRPPSYVHVGNSWPIV